MRYSDRAYNGLCVLINDIGRRPPFQLQCSYPGLQGDVSQSARKITYSNMYSYHAREKRQQITASSVLAHRILAWFVWRKGTAALDTAMASDCSGHAVNDFGDRVAGLWRRDCDQRSSYSRCSSCALFL